MVQYCDNLAIRSGVCQNHLIKCGTVDCIGRAKEGIYCETCAHRVQNLTNCLAKNCIAIPIHEGFCSSHKADWKFLKRQGVFSKEDWNFLKRQNMLSNKRNDYIFCKIEIVTDLLFG